MSRQKITRAKVKQSPGQRARGAGKPDARDPDKQDRLTPPEFLDAVERKFGPIVFDLAAERGKSVRGVPCFTKEDDALKQDWLRIPDVANWKLREKVEPLLGNRFLNPEFGMFAEFTRRAAEYSSAQCPVLLLHLASIDANWYERWVYPFAISWSLDRIQFVGETKPFTKPLMLSLYGFGGGFGIQRWHWKADNANAAHGVLQWEQRCHELGIDPQSPASFHRSKKKMCT